MSSPELPVEDVTVLGAGVRASRVRQLLAQPTMLSIEYQPVVDVRRRVVSGYEVLARMPGADGPSSWFSGAHEEGLGPRLELLVLARSATQLPVLPEGRLLSVNVSVETLLHPGVREILDAAGDLAGRLILEVTEKLDAEAVAQLLPVVTELRTTGVRIAVGDAAGGYVGLSGVGALRPDVVKIDRSVVKGAHRDDVRRSLAELVRSLAVRQGAHVVAVGVEEAEDLELLVDSGVRYVQGYLVGRPGPVMAELEPDVVALLETLRVPPLVGSAGLVRQPDDVLTATDAESSPTALVPTQASAPEPETSSEVEFVRVVVTPTRMPVALVVGPDAEDVRTAPVALRVELSSPIVDVARAVAARKPRFRYDPVVVVDDEGRLQGVFTVTELLAHLADRVED